MSLACSYQTPDPLSFETRKAPRISFDDYRDRISLDDQDLPTGVTLYQLPAQHQALCGA